MKECRNAGMQKESWQLAIMTLLLLFISLTLSAQTNIKAVQDAFETSYAQEKKGELNKAMSTLTAVYAEDSYEINARLGWLNYVAGLFTESMAYYQKAIKLKPYAIEARFGFVNPAYALGNLDQVITQYQEILKIDPQNTIANYRMASIYYGKNDFAMAGRYIDKVVNLYPFDYDSHLLYGWILLKQGKTREAQVMFNKVLIIKPKDVSATQGLSQIK